MQNVLWEKSCEIQSGEWLDGSLIAKIKKKLQFKWIFNNRYLKFLPVN